MRSSRCTFSTVAALHRVFIAPIESSRILPTHHLPAARAPKPRHVSTGLWRPTQLPSEQLPSAKQRLPRDDEIQDRLVRLVTADNQLSPPQYTSRLLNSLDRQTEMLVMVARHDRDPDPDSEESVYPICRIQSKEAMRAAEKARRKKKEPTTAITKTIELNWAIDAHDLQHRLQRVKEFLSKGWKVDIVMAGKRKGKKATPHEAAMVVGRIREAVNEVDGAKEWRDMDGNLGASATMFLQGKLAEKE